MLLEGLLLPTPNLPFQPFTLKIINCISQGKDYL